CPCEIDLADRSRRNHIDDAMQFAVGKRETYDPDNVLQVDPTDPLVARPEPAAKPEPNRQRQKPEDGRLASENGPDPKAHDTNIQGFGPPSLPFPGATNLGQK